MVLVIMVFGILVVFFRVKKRKKQLLVNKIKTLTTADEDIEMKVKQEQTTADQPPYTEMSTEAPPHVPNKSEYLMEYFNEKKTLSLVGIVKLNWNMTTVRLPSL